MWACQKQFQLLTPVPIFPNPNQAGNHSLLPWGIFTLEKLKKHWIPIYFKKYWMRMRAETKRSACVYSKCMENTSKQDIGLSILESGILFFFLYHCNCPNHCKKINSHTYFCCPQAFSVSKALFALMIMCITHGHIHLSPHLTIPGLDTSEDTKWVWRYLYSGEIHR